jgi:hypothetical protein
VTGYVPRYDARPDRDPSSTARQLEAAYRADPFHALRQNLESVQSDEWSVRPAEWRADVFGQNPVLSICDQVAHVAGARFMYADRAFGEARLEWGAIEPPSRDRESMLAWLDEWHAVFAAGLVALADDAG